MKYIDDVNLLKKNASTVHGAALVEKMKADIEWFDINFTDFPDVDSGWGHAYFCPHDGAVLTYNRQCSERHVCPICGEVFCEEIYNAAWVYMYRYEALMSALESATLYKLEQNDKYLAHFMRIIGFYSDNYSKFAEHGKGPTTSGNGKITPQALNEAIFLTKTINGLELVKNALPAEFINSVKKNLLIPGAKFINAQKKIIHNIPCWINAGVGTIGLFCSDTELISFAFDKPLGLIDQIRQGVTKSFFWYEGSIHYNFFTIESFLNLLLFAKIYEHAIPQDINDIVYNMMLAPCKMAFSSAVLPNPNDGWPNLNLKTYSYLYEMAAKIFDSAELNNILANIYSQQISRTPLPMSSPIYCGDACMEQLLFSCADCKAAPLDIWQSSYCFDASNYAMLRSDNVEVFVKYGHCSPSHAHPDKMNIEVSAFGTLISRDLSNCGYAARLCNEYHRTSVSHNTVVLNGQTHPSTERGKCLQYTACINTPSIKAFAKNAYSGIDFTREIFLEPQGFCDTFKLEGKKTDSTADWFFHCEGSLMSEPEALPCSLGFFENGYQHFHNMRRLVNIGDNLKLCWQFVNQIQGIQLLSTHNFEVYLCDSYDNPVNHMRTTVIMRSKDENPIFKQHWDFNEMQKASM